MAEPHRQTSLAELGCGVRRVGTHGRTADHHPLRQARRVEHSGVDLGSIGYDTTDASAPEPSSRTDEVRDWEKRVIVLHSNGHFSRYRHVASITIKEGQRVSRATTLGIMGQTGQSSGKHFHYQDTTGGTDYYTYDGESCWDSEDLNSGGAVSTSAKQRAGTNLRCWPHWLHPIIFQTM
jgi:hypothetical protein